jgi:S-(hydroxymethyl)glutathione dehydrogenase/alcohol dehydrogenase
MQFPKTMRAAILDQLNQPLIIDEVELPKELYWGQVLVKVFYTSICGSQLGEIDGVKGKDPYLPHLLGHEGSGEVIEVGPGVKTVSIGDHVVLHWMVGNGIQSDSPKYQWKGRPLNAGWVTTFNEYAVVSENRVTVIPKDFDLKIAPLFGCAVTTAFGIINNKAQLKIGQSIVVFGAGGVGLNVIQGARMVSAYPIIAVDIFDNKLQLAKHLGATHCINSNKINIKDEVYKILGKQGSDVVIDNTGLVNIIELAYELTSSDGKTILVGVPPVGQNVSLYTLPLHFGKTITGTKGGECCPQIDIPRYIRLLQNHGYILDELLADHFSLDQINDAIRLMKAGQIAGRCLIKFA